MTAHSETLIDAEGFRVCTSCAERKPMDAYYKNPRYRGGFVRQCRKCQSEKNLVPRRALRAAQVRTPADRRKAKDESLRRFFGIDIEIYEAMRFLQDNCCLACSQPERIVDKRNGLVKDLAVDHCHVTGVVRGLLCSLCNTGIGALGDDIEGLKAALRYLEAAPVAA